MEHMKVGEDILFPLKKGWFIVITVPKEVVEAKLNTLIANNFRLAIAVEFMLHNNNVSIVVSNERYAKADIGLYRANNQFFIIKRNLTN